MTKQPWPEDRRKEFETLVRLVHIANNLNHSSGVAGNIGKLEGLSEQLLHCEYAAPRQSFLDWLEKEATGQ